MRINVYRHDKLQMYSTGIDYVQNFTYLGSIVSTTGGPDEDIAARKRKDLNKPSKRFSIGLEKPSIKYQHQC